MREAETQPGVVWEVYAGLPKGTPPDVHSPHHIGSLLLFGAGIRSEAHKGHKEFKPARFLNPLNRALEAALKRPESDLTVMFVPVGIVVEGKPMRPTQVPGQNRQSKSACRVP